MSKMVDMSFELHAECSSSQNPEKNSHRNTALRICAAFFSSLRRFPHFKQEGTFRKHRREN